MADDRTKKSLRYSILDGAFYSLKTGLADSFFAMFAIFLNATSLQLSLLGSLPLTISSTLQLFSQRLLFWLKSRKKLILYSYILQGISLIFLILIFVSGKLNVNIMIIFIVIYWIFDKLPLPAWNSLIGDLIKEGKRGEYFGQRNKINGISSFFGLILGGIILNIFGVREKAFAFTLIFSLAVLARFISAYFMNKMHDPEFEIRKKPHFSFIEFIKRGANSNYSNFVIYMSLMMLAVFMVAPLFAAFILNDIGLSYVQFTMLTAAAVLVKFFTLPLWGHAADKFGTRKIMGLSSFIVAIAPLLFILNKNFYYLIIANMIAGFGWAGFDLAAMNYIFDSTSQRKRATCVMYNNFLNGIGILLGSLFAAFIVKHNHLFWSSYVLVFLISSILRFIVNLIFLPRIKEVRQVEHIPYNKLLFDVLTIKPTIGFMVRIITFKKK